MLVHIGHLTRLRREAIDNRCKLLYRIFFYDECVVWWRQNCGGVGSAEVNAAFSSLGCFALAEDFGDGERGLFFFFFFFCVGFGGGNMSILSDKFFYCEEFRWWGCVFARWGCKGVFVVGVGSFAVELSSLGGTEAQLRRDFCGGQFTRHDELRYCRWYTSIR